MKIHDDKIFPFSFLQTILLPLFYHSSSSSFLYIFSFFPKKRNILIPMKKKKRKSFVLINVKRENKYRKKMTKKRDIRYAFYTTHSLPLPLPLPTSGLQEKRHRLENFFFFFTISS